MDIKYMAMVTKLFCATLLLTGTLILSCLILAAEGQETMHGPEMNGQSRPAETSGTSDEIKKTVAARVNGVNIDLRSVTELMNRMDVQKGHGHAGNKPDNEKEIMNKALDRLIFEELAFQRANNEGIKVEPAEISKNIADIKQKLGGDEAFRRALQARNLTEEGFRTAMARNILLQKIFKVEIFDKTPAIPENEIEREYEREKDKFVVAEKILVLDTVIFLNAEDKGSAEKAEQILKKILEDKDHNPLNLAPDGTFIVSEIEINKEKQPEIYAAARKLKAGQISGIIETSDSMHIVKLKEYVPEKQFALSEIKGFLESKLRKAAITKKSHEWEMELRKAANIEIIDGK